MIFGKDNEAKHKLEQARCLRMVAGVKRFAFLPISLEDDRWLWLETYYSYYNGLQYDNGTLSVWSGSRDSYSPVYRNYETDDWRHIRLDIENVDEVNHTIKWEQATDDEKRALYSLAGKAI